MPVYTVHAPVSNDEVAAGLAKEGFRVLRPQPRGMLGSKGPLKDITLHDLARDIAEVIARENAGPAVIVGHAYGNWVARMTAVDHPKQRPQTPEHSLAISPIPLVGERRQKLHVADQVGQTELERHVELALVTTIGREIVAPQNPVELLAQNRDQHIAAARRIDLEQRVQVGPKTPDPLP